MNENEVARFIFTEELVSAKLNWKQKGFRLKEKFDS
jgi:hypothetical protein